MSGPFLESEEGALLKGIFLNFVVADPLILRMIEAYETEFVEVSKEAGCELYNEFRVFMEEEQTQWINQIQNYYPDFCLYIELIDRKMKGLRPGDEDLCKDHIPMKAADSFDFFMDYTLLQVSLHSILKL